MVFRSDVSDESHQVDELFAEYLLRVNRAESINRVKFMRKYSGYAEELRELMAADELLRCM